MSTTAPNRPPVVPAPQWVAPLWDLREGRDPLGLQTTTTDRLLPVLLPGLIELSQQARYFSFYAYLLSEYERRKLGGSRAELDRFVRRAEWDYGLAVLGCDGCDTSPQGRLRLGPVLHEHAHADRFPRGESVQSTLGGYGLYYRAPMNELGLIAREGSLLGEDPIPIDVLARTDRAARLAETFTAAIVETAYHRQGWIVRTEPLPREVVDEYARTACLCLLPAYPEERDAVQNALFGRDPAPVAGPHAGADATTPGAAADPRPREATGLDEVDAVTQRGRSVAHFLTLVDHDPAVVDDPSAYRQALWDATGDRSEAHRRVAGQWAGLVAKDVWQEALCSVWTSFCRDGLARSRELGRPLGPDEVEAVARALTGEPPALSSTQPTRLLIDTLVARQLRVTVPAVALADDGDVTGDVETEPTSLAVEQLRRTAAGLDSATYGLLVLFELARRVRQRSGPGWDSAIWVRSSWQPSVGEVVASLDQHLPGSPTVDDTMWWITSRFVINVHERIAYSKLPQRLFTFRFRWEDARLRFYDHGMERFTLAAARHTPFVQLTHALGMWARSGPDAAAALTARGRAFIDTHLPT